MVSTAIPTREALLLTLLIMTLAFGGIVEAQPQSLIKNGGFERLHQVKPDAHGLVSGWRVAAPAQLPTDWTLNTHYVGQFAVGTDGAHSGRYYARITSPKDGSAHLYQMCPGLQLGKWYRVTFWLRGGPATVQTYDYYAQGRTRGTTLLRGGASAAHWQRYVTYFQPSGKGYQKSALALTVSGGASADFDDVSLEAISENNVPQPGPAVSFESEAIRLTFDGQARLAGLESLPSGKEYRAPGDLRPAFAVVRNGVLIPAGSLTSQGDELHLGFLDGESQATVRVTSRHHQILFEVLKVTPDDVSEFLVTLPVARLKTIGSAFGATYDPQFGMCLLGLTNNTQDRAGAAGGGAAILTALCTKEPRLAGARFALVAAPYSDFKAAVMEAERDNGLPCPMLGGKWARDSEAVRRSYLFATDASEANIDTLIKYAKIAHFGAILLLKNCWLADHGHYDINTTNFPHGRAGLRAAVDKIHRAGLQAGVHVFGPSISPNDPYITPKPDDRLASVPCPPLAQAIDAKTTTITLTGQPDLPPKGPEDKAFPGHYLRIGDEIISYGEAQVGPPFRYLHCQRGACGTTPAPHPAGAPVKGLLTMWGFFLVDPNSTLADEVTHNFADVFNACNFDFVYFDASDGILDYYLNRAYYLNRMHLGYYRAIGRDILYQTSTGTGTNLLWHIVPRSASADGHGDIKGYLDARWPGILKMADNWTRPDIGWYYWFKEVRPDQIEYVCAKALGVDGSISLETSQTALETNAQSRQMMDMIGRWEECRKEGVFSASIKAKLREPKKDFKLFRSPQGKWTLCRASYEQPRTVDVLDGKSNTWTIINPRRQACDLGVELLRESRTVALGDYTGPGALQIEDFSNLKAYLPSSRNDFEKFVQGDNKDITATGVVRQGVTQTIAAGEGKTGKTALLYSANNAGGTGGWGGIGRRFATPLNLQPYRGLGLWIQGDGGGETLRLQLRDIQGRHVDFLPVITFKGWRLYTFAFPVDKAFDWSKVAYLLFYFNGISDHTRVHLTLDGVRALPAVKPVAGGGHPVLTVNGQRLDLPALGSGQTITSEGPGGARLWPGGMVEGRPLTLTPGVLRLRPGANQITFSWQTPQAFPGGVQVLLYQIWPMEK